MISKDLLAEIKQSDFVLSSSWSLDSALKEYYSNNLYVAMKAAYESGILINILAERYCNNEMLGIFINKLSEENGISKNDAQSAIVEWVELFAEVYGLSNNINLRNPLELDSEKYRPSYEFMPFIELSKVYDYSLCLSKCRSGRGTLSDIGIVIAILNDYLFTDQDLAKSDAGLYEINKNKKQSIGILLEVLPLLKGYRYLEPFYLISMAQTKLLNGEYQEAISYYEELLKIREISNPVDLDEDYYCGELETAAMIAHNIVCTYKWASMPEQAAQAKIKYRKFFELQKEYNEDMIIQFYSNKNDERSIEMREYYKKKVDDLCNKDDFAYFDLSVKGHFHGLDSYLVAMLKDCKVNNAPTDISVDKVGIEVTKEGYLIATDYEYDDGTVFMCLPKHIEKKEVTVGESDLDPFSKASVKKYDIETWSIADCEEIFGYFGDLYVAKCEYSFGKEGMVEGLVAISIEDGSIKVAHKCDGVEYINKFSLKNLTIKVSTFPSISKIIINNRYNEPIN